MKIDLDPFLVEENSKVNLRKRPTRVKPLYKSEDNYERLLEKQKAELDELQKLQYAHDRYALLLIFQAPDAAGKDGAIRHVMSGIDPQGSIVHSFKKPSAEEIEHDFLWRAARALPERGRIGIFNRSYYEEVLIARVHPEILEGQHLPDEVLEDKGIWKKRYRSIVDFEAHLNRNGTRIVKFYLHLSRDEQRERFLARIDEPDKNWKMNLADVEESKYWKDYRKAYEAAVEATSTREAPWYVVPADDKKNARLIVSEIIVETMKKLKMTYPKPTAEHLKELRDIRKKLTKS